MKTINLNKTWEHLAAAVHQTKPDRNNLLKRKALFGLQILLSQYELAKNEKNKELMKFCADVLETYEKHNINGHIIWKKIISVLILDLIIFSKLFTSLIIR